MDIAKILKDSADEMGDCEISKFARIVAEKIEQDRHSRAMTEMARLTAQLDRQLIHQIWAASGSNGKTEAV